MTTATWQSVCERKSIPYFGEIEICLRCQPEPQENLFIFKHGGTYAFGLERSDGLIHHIEHSGIETVDEVRQECENWYEYSSQNDLTHGDGKMTNRTAEAMIDKWDGVLATMETGECETCSREFPVDAMTHHEESATSECHQCGQATTGGRTNGELIRVAKRTAGC